MLKRIFCFVISISIPLGSVATAQQLKLFNIASNDLVYSKKLDRLIVSTEGRQDKGSLILVIDPMKKEIEKEIYAGSQPNQIHLTDDEGMLFVSFRGEYKYSTISLESFAIDEFQLTGNDFPKDIFTLNSRFADFGLLSGRLNLSAQSKFLENTAGTLSSRYLTSTNDSLIWTFNLGGTPGRLCRTVINESGYVKSENFRTGPVGVSAQMISEHLMLSNSGSVIDLLTNPPETKSQIVAEPNSGLFSSGVFAHQEGKIYQLKNDREDQHYIFSEYDLEFNLLQSWDFKETSTLRLHKMIAMNNNHFAFITREGNGSGTQMGIIRLCESTITDRPSIEDSAAFHCSGDTAHLTIKGPLADKIIWSTGDQSQDLHVAASGEYYAAYLDESGCRGPWSEPQHLRIRKDPGGVDILQGADELLCGGDSVELRLYGNHLALWSTGDTSKRIWIKSAGNYSVQKIDSFGCLGSRVSSINIEEIPRKQVEKPIIVSLENEHFCAGRQAYIGVLSPKYDLRWKHNYSKNSIIRLDNYYRNFVVEYVDDHGCTLAESDTFFVNIVESPFPQFVLQGNQIEALVEGDVTWYLDGIMIEGVNSKKLTVSQPGMYTISVIKDQCIFYPPSFYFVEQLKTVAQNTEPHINIRIPSKGDLSFITDAPLQPGEFIQLVTPEGEVLEKYHDVKPSDQTFFEVSASPNNTHFIQLVEKDGTVRISQKIKSSQ